MAGNSTIEASRFLHIEADSMKFLSNSTSPFLPNESDSMKVSFLAILSNKKQCILSYKQKHCNVYKPLKPYKLGGGLEPTIFCSGGSCLTTPPILNKVFIYVPRHGGVVQWTSHPPQEQEVPGSNPARV
jgi:hypothetical protein